jgi:hypothetical protein
MGAGKERGLTSLADVILRIAEALKDQPHGWK